MNKIYVIEVDAQDIIASEKGKFVLVLNSTKEYNHFNSLTEQQQVAILVNNGELIIKHQIKDVAVKYPTDWLKGINLN